MNELPHDPNIALLPFELGCCLVLVILACAALGLTSCAGTTYEPCLSVTNADGKEVKACVRIERSARSEDIPVLDEETERTGMSSLLGKRTGTSSPPAKE